MLFKSVRNVLSVGGVGYHAIWAYSSIAMATFLVRTLKRVIFQEAQQYSEFVGAELLCVWLGCMRRNDQ